jgi:hypothetical protein
VSAQDVTFFTDRAFSEIARYGRSSVPVTCRLLEAVRSVGSCVQHEAVDDRARFMETIFFNGWFTLLRTAVVGILAYAHSPRACSRSPFSSRCSS